MDAAEILGGRYRLVDRVGVGGMSVVWRAQDEVLDREVAVKVLAPTLAGDAVSRGRIRQEAKAVARLAHPNITAVHDYGTARCAADDGTSVEAPYVVMELVGGESLSVRLRRVGALPWRAAARIGAEVAAALAEAHSRGLVHRDIKPGNIMLTHTGVKVVDFGIAAMVGDEADDLTGGELLGTPAYVAPERLTGAPAAPPTDVYALGLLLYKMLTGGLPWAAETATEILKAHRYVEPRPLPPVPMLRPEVAALVHRCLAKDPADRPTSAEVAARLADAAGVRVMLPEAGGAIDETTLEVRCVGRKSVQDGPDEDATHVVPLVAPHRHREAPRAHRWHPVSPLAGVADLLATQRRKVTVAGGVGAAACAAVAGVLAFGTGGAEPASQAHASGPDLVAAGLTENPAACQVSWNTTADSAGTFSVNLTVANTGSADVSGWELTFSFPGDQQVTEGRDGTWTQSGSTVLVHDGGTNATLGSGQSTVLSFDGRYTAGNPLPTAFTLNGAACDPVVSGVTAAPTTVPPAPAATTASKAGGSGGSGGTATAPKPPKSGKGDKGGGPDRKGKH